MRQIFKTMIAISNANGKQLSAEKMMAIMRTVMQNIDMAPDEDQRIIMNFLIDRIDIKPEKEKGKWVKSIRFKIPINIPDFTILSRRTEKEIYWEHDGRMDDPKYSGKAVRKINSYIHNEIMPGDRLILTFETSNTVLNDRTIKKMIDNFLL